MTRECLCELDLSLGRRELIMTFIYLYFFFITQARLVWSSETNSGLLSPMWFLSQ